MWPPSRLIGKSICEVSAKLWSSRLTSSDSLPAAFGRAAAGEPFLLRGGVAAHADGQSAFENPILFLRPKKKKLRPDRARTQRHLKNKRHIGGWFYKWLGS